MGPHYATEAQATFPDQAPRKTPAWMGRSLSLRRRFDEGWAGHVSVKTVRCPLVAAGYRTTFSFFVRLTATLLRRLEKMGSVSWLLLLVLLGAVDAVPTRAVSEALSARDDPHKDYAGEPPTERTVFVVVSLVFTMVLSLLLGMFAPGPMGGDC